MCLPINGYLEPDMCTLRSGLILKGISVTKEMEEDEPRCQAAVLGHMVKKSTGTACHKV